MQETPQDAHSPGLPMGLDTHELSRHRAERHRGWETCPSPEHGLNTEFCWGRISRHMRSPTRAPGTTLSTQRRSVGLHPRWAAPGAGWSRAGVRDTSDREGPEGRPQTLLPGRYRVTISLVLTGQQPRPTRAHCLAVVAYTEMHFQQ